MNTVNAVFTHRKMVTRYLLLAGIIATEAYNFILSIEYYGVPADRRILFSTLMIASGFVFFVVKSANLLFERSDLRMLGSTVFLGALLASLLALAHTPCIHFSNSDPFIPAVTDVVAPDCSDLEFAIFSQTLPAFYATLLYFLDVLMYLLHPPERG